MNSFINSSSENIQQPDFSDAPSNMTFEEFKIWFNSTQFSSFDSESDLNISSCFDNQYSTPNLLFSLNTSYVNNSFDYFTCNDEISFITVSDSSDNYIKQEVIENNTVNDNDDEYIFYELSESSESSSNIKQQKSKPIIEQRRNTRINYSSPRNTFTLNRQKAEIQLNIPHKTTNNNTNKHVRPSGLVETIKNTNDVRYNILNDFKKHQMEDYAKGYFKHHKKGFLRRTIKVESLLEWSKEIKGSLLNNLSDKHEKLAVDIFKKIQIYMGDRIKQKNDKSEIISDIARQGIRIMELRNEIYCQICKQVTLNPSIDSTLKGWELFAIIINSFPCSSELEPYIRSFLYSSAFVITSNVSVYAAYCLRHYNSRWNTSTISCNSREQIQKEPFNGALFGGSISEIMNQQQINYPNVKIPRVFAIICDSILQNKGYDKTGIFRKSPSFDKIYQMKVLLENGCSELPQQDPHIYACLLKNWFADLKYPLIPNNLYNHFINNYDNIEELSTIIYNNLPVYNRYILFYLIRFLRFFAKPEISKKTQMTVLNLAIVFSPNLFRCPMISCLITNARIENNVLEILIKRLEIPDIIPGVYSSDIKL